MPDDFDASDDHGGWDDEDVPDEDYPQPEPPWAAAGPQPYRDVPPRRWPARYGVTLVLTAVIAGAAGFFAVIVVRDLSTHPAAASSAAPAGGPSPGASVPAPGGGTVPGNSQGLELAIGGKVAAVSAASITVAGPGHHVTAAVTSATKVTGRVRDIGGVKIGDEVSLQATGTEGNLTATAIQDPASLP
jgi:hypothetical protein